MKVGQKRFIAGAVCPRCSKQDKIVLYQVSETEQRRQCIACDFEDVMQDDAPAEPPTPVNQPRPGEKPLSHEDQLDVVTLIDPGQIDPAKKH